MKIYFFLKEQREKTTGFCVIKSHKLYGIANSLQIHLQKTWETKSKLGS